MSLQELSNFIFALEHSLSLRKELIGCKSNKMIIAIAKKYGYILTENDLTENSIEQNINKWFQISKVSPIKK